jgi:hypothetical protein
MLGPKESMMIARRVGRVLGVLIAVGMLFYASLASAQIASPRARDAALAEVSQVSAAERAAAWLVDAHQNDDGGYASFSTGANKAPSTPGGTFDAMLALTAVGYPAHAPYPGEARAPVDYLLQNLEDVIDYAGEDGAQAGKAVMALAAAGEDPRDFGGSNFVALLKGHQKPNGQLGSDPYKQSLAMLGLAASGESVPASAVNWLKARQGPGGAWDDGFGTAENADATAMAIMALIAAGQSPSSNAVKAGIDFLDATQLAGGWEYGPGFGTNANSTGLVIQALSAAGEPWYESSGRWVMDGATPLEALAGWQAASGAFQADFGQGRFDDFFATVQSLPALSGKAFPLPAYGEAARLALSCLDGLQDPATAGWEQFTGAGVNAGGTARAVQAIVAGGDDPESPRWTVGNRNAVEALESLTPDYLEGGRGGRIGVVMQGVAAAGAPYDVNDFAGEDLVLKMSGVLSPTGEYDSTAFGIYAHSTAMLGLLKVGEPVAPKSIEVLVNAGTAGDYGDPDSNGIALQVFGELGRRSAPATLAALRASQTEIGGWGFGGDVSPSSSSEVVRGLSALGQNPFGPRWSRVHEGKLSNAADAVLAQQDDSGCWPNLFGPGADVYGTVDAILLLTERSGWGPVEIFAPVVASPRGS